MITCAAEGRENSGFPIIFFNYVKTPYERQGFGLPDYACDFLYISISIAILVEFVEIIPHTAGTALSGPVCGLSELGTSSIILFPCLMA